MEFKNINKISIGFIGYNKATARYLPYFLPSLSGAVSYYSNKTNNKAEIVCFDNSEEKDSENVIFIKNNYPQVIIEWPGVNLGFAKAYNRMINKAIDSGVKYFLAINPDMIFEEDFLVKLEKVLEDDKKCGAVQPKILKFDFENNKKTNIVDSYGMKITRDHCFFDRYQGEKDPQENGGEIFGFTGAAVLFDIEALKDVAYNNGEYLEFFDELMFMYKEDADLSYRLRLAGWKIILDSSAVAYHDRTASTKGENIKQIIKNRKEKSRLLKSWSYLNQWIILLKFKKLNWGLGARILTWWYQFKALIFIIIFERFLLKDFLRLWKFRHEIVKRRKSLKVLPEGMRSIKEFMN